MSWPECVFRGRSAGCSDWLRRRDVPDSSEAVTARETCLTLPSGNRSSNRRPIATARGMFVADASHVFHATTRRSGPSSATPKSTASNSLQDRSFWAVSSIRGQRSFACRPCDEFVQQNLQRFQGGQIHQERDVTLQVALTNGKVDVDKENEIAARGRRRQVEQRGAVAAQDFGQGYRQGPLQQIGDGGEAAVQDDVAGLGEGFVLEFEDVLERE